MTLKIEISNINSSEATDFVAACRDVQDFLNKNRSIEAGGEASPFDLASMQFEFKADSQPNFKVESTSFERYINSTKKE